MSGNQSATESVVRLATRNIFEALLRSFAERGCVDPELFSCFGRGLLSDKEILEQYEQGNIIIHPFNRADLGTSSYDLRLGNFFYVERIPQGNRIRIFNPYSEAHVRRVWGEQPVQGVLREKLENRKMLLDYLQKRAELRDIQPHNVMVSRLEEELESFRPEEELFFLFPGETVLAHTNEFIGYKQYGTTMMKARSSVGRSFLEVCKCAGMGDAGYFNRWTMEITNNSRHHIIPLVVGRRVAQLAFFHVGETIGDYNSNGKYQQTQDLGELVRSWNTSMMLPRLYADRDAVPRPR